MPLSVRSERRVSEGEDPGRGHVPSGNHRGLPRQNCRGLRPAGEGNRGEAGMEPCTKRHRKPRYTACGSGAMAAAPAPTKKAPTQDRNAQS